MLNIVCEQPKFMKVHESLRIDFLTVLNEKYNHFVLREMSFSRVIILQNVNLNILHEKYISYIFNFENILTYII